MPRGVSRLDEATIQRRLWTPVEFRPTAWFDAFDRSTIAVANGVSSWTNKGTVGLAASQATGANQPLYRVSDGDINRRGYPYLDFDGTNDDLSLAAGIGGSAQGVMYLFAVARAPSNVQWKNVVFGSADISLWSLRDLPTGVSSSQWRFVGLGTMQDANYTNGRLVNSINFTGFSTGSQTLATDTWAVYSRELITISGTPGINFNHNPTYIARGDGGAGTTTSSTKIAECLAIPFQIGGRGRQMVEGYLSWKWNLPLVADHPFANQPPLIGS